MCVATLNVISEYWLLNLFLYNFKAKTVFYAIQFLLNDDHHSQTGQFNDVCNPL